ncbi:unnamed protein product [Owenia fusiformis]|uniref:Uncharacterized protein n=1 Tax=Owenia fusiformis TaxID=6347 RepID=A0A8S4N6R3_OWEFU|nr:unnamed protein product [Owenia fusiformis]
MDIIGKILTFLCFVHIGSCLDCYTCSSGGFGSQSKDCPSSGAVNTYVLRPTSCSGVCYTRNNAQNIGEVIHGCSSDADVTIPDVMLSPDCYEWSSEMWCICNTSGCNRFPLGYVPSEESLHFHKEHSYKEHPREQHTNKEHPDQEHPYNEHLPGEIIIDTIMMDKTITESNDAVIGVTVDMATEPVAMETTTSISPMISVDEPGDTVTMTTQDDTTYIDDTLNGITSPYTSVTIPTDPETLQNAHVTNIPAPETELHVTTTNVLTNTGKLTHVTSVDTKDTISKVMDVISDYDDVINDIEHLKAIEKYLQTEFEMKTGQNEPTGVTVSELPPFNGELKQQYAELLRQDDQSFIQDDQSFIQDDQSFIQDDRPLPQVDKPFNHVDTLQRGRLNGENIVDDFHDNSNSYQWDEDDQRYQQRQNNVQWNWQAQPILGQQSIYPNNFNYQNQRRSRFRNNRHGNNIPENTNFQHQQVYSNTGHFRPFQPQKQDVVSNGNQVDHHSNQYNQDRHSSNEFLHGNSKKSQTKITTTQNPPKRITTSKVETTKIDGNPGNKKRKHMFHNYNILNGEIYARNPAGTQNDRKIQIISIKNIPTMTIFEEII